MNVRELARPNLWPLTPAWTACSVTSRYTRASSSASAASRPDRVDGAGPLICLCPTSRAADERGPFRPYQPAQVNLLELRLVGETEQRPRLLDPSHVDGLSPHNDLEFSAERGLMVALDAPESRLLHVLGSAPHPVRRRPGSTGDERPYITRGLGPRRFRTRGPP